MSGAIYVPEAADFFPVNDLRYANKTTTDNAIAAAIAAADLDVDTLTAAIALKETRRFFNVLDYGAVGDAATDNRAFLQAAIDAAESAGGGVVWFPKGVYLMTDYTDTTGGMRQQLVVGGDGVVLMGEGRQSIIRSSVSNARPLTYLGHAKGRAGSTWQTYEAYSATVYAPSGSILQGAVSITLATPAQAANFAVGDAVFIRTGQCTANATPEPDAEINEVSSVNTSTGVIGLRWPTTKAYAQENYSVGSSGVSAVGGGGTAAPYGIANVQDRILRGCGMRDLALECPASTLQALSIWQLLDFDAHNVTIIHNQNGAGSKSVRWCKIDGCRWEHRSTPVAGSSDYWLSPSTGCSNWVITGNTFVSTGTGSIEIHEGCAKVRFAGNDLAFVQTGAAVDPVGINVRSRAYDVAVEDNHILAVTDTDTNVIFVDSTCSAGGSVQRNRARGIGARASIRVDIPNTWLVRGNESLGSLSGHTSLGFPNGLATLGQVETISAVVAFDGTTRTIGTIPAYCVVLRVWVEVQEAFNSSGTDLVTVGYSGSASAYATAVDVSSTGVKAVTLGAGIGRSVGTARSAQAVYTPGGSAATTGKALVIIEYTRVARRD